MQSSFLGFAPPVNIYVMFNKIEGRKMATLRDRAGQTYKAPVFLVSSHRIIDDVSGRMEMTSKAR